MNIVPTIFRIGALMAAGLFLSGCNPVSQGWTSSGGGAVSTARMIAARKTCGYQQARQRAMNLMDARGDKRKNQRRALRVMDKADYCMRRQGVRSRSGSAWGIGRLK